MMQPRKLCIITLFYIFATLLPGSGSHAQTVATLDDCRPLVPVDSSGNEKLDYSGALLWKIQRGNTPPSYLFGTIHVADERITRLPDIIRQTLIEAGTFVMEALPEAGESLLLSQMMTFNDERTLRDFIGEDLFNRTTTILASYDFPADAVLKMKPWAAFLVMNYPVEEGLPLDLQLFRMAEQNNAQLVGLETLSEQGEIFATMAMENQVQLLLDTVCNYETVNSDFEAMKALYLQRDLQGLYQYGARYTVSSEELYMKLLEKLLFERNRRMAQRLQPVLEQGDAFIAIGAMHLPGDDGILSLLDKQGYSITPLY